jgi:hypothetical protein
LSYTTGLDNPLFVPEIGSSPEYVSYFYPVLRMAELVFHLLASTTNGLVRKKKKPKTRLASIARNMRWQNPMMRELAKWSFEGKIKSVVEREDHAEQTINLGLWQLTVSFGASRRNNIEVNSHPIGKAMVVQLGENEFILIGTLCHFTFKPLGANEGKAWQYLKVEEGQI